jgi:hypothetical protein
MAVSNFTTCAICGKEYNYCPSCEQHKGYRYYADTPECFQVFLILQDIREGIINETEAVERFNHIGITLDYDFTQMISSVATDVKRILGGGSEVKPKEKKTK